MGRQKRKDDSQKFKQYLCKTVLKHWCLISTFHPITSIIVLLYGHPFIKLHPPLQFRNVSPIFWKQEILTFRKCAEVESCFRNKFMTEHLALWTVPHWVFSEETFFWLGPYFWATHSSQHYGIKPLTFISKFFKLWRS